MKRLTILTALAGLSAGALADDGWVSVGATRVVAPASATTSMQSSESAPAASVSPSVSPVSAPAPGSNELLGEMMIQMRQMRDEIAMLRGMVEEQQAQLQKMEVRQQDRYLDLDGRISALAAAPTMAANNTPSDVVASGASDEVSLPPVGDAYRAAMELVKGKKFAEARDAFDALAKNYSSDPLAVNALYWAGEVSLVDGNASKAETRFRTIVDSHADHSKAPDAMYKLGVALDRQGKSDEAKALMAQVIERYDGVAASTVTLAQSYLKKLNGGAK